jgi:HK97 gp10 family phage protein
MALKVRFRGRKNPGTVPRMIAYVQTESGRATYNLARAIKKHARRNAPVGDRVYTDEEGHTHPGYLRDSIVLIKTGSTWTVTVQAHYGIYQEYGTRYHAAQPFWHQAIATAIAERDVLTTNVEEGLT